MPTPRPPRDPRPPPRRRRSTPPPPPPPAVSPTASYTPARGPPGERRSDEARLIPVAHREVVANIRSDAYVRALRQTAPARPEVKPQLTDPQTGEPLPIVGTLLKSGVSGTAYRARSTPAFLAWLKTLMDGGVHVVRAYDPRPGTDVIVKISKPHEARRGTIEQWRREQLREIDVHKSLSRDSTCVPIPACAPLCSESFVPKYYAGAMVVDAATGRRHFVIVMAVAPGARVWDQRPVTADVYVAVERALASMWTQGVAHGDAHFGNVYYDPRTRVATAIDFDLAVRLPPPLVAALPARLAQGVATGVRSLADVFDPASPIGVPGLVQHMNGVQYSRTLSWYNPDFTALRALYNKMSRAERQRVPAARRRLWAYAPRSPSPTNASPRRAAAARAAARALAGRSPDPRRRRE